MHKEGIDIATLLSKVFDIREHMEDELSIELFDLRLKYFYDRDEEAFCDAITNMPEFKWRIPRLERMINNNPASRNLIIFGAGRYGRRTYRLLENLVTGGRQIIFCDNNPAVLEKLESEDYAVISPNEMIRNHLEDIVIIAGKNSRYSLYDQLEFTGFPDERILNPRFGMIQAFCGNQYFDYLRSDCQNEVFIDAGCYDGSTSVAFSEWANGYEKIYAWEANPNFIKQCETMFVQKKLSNVELVPFAVWNKKDMIKFISSPYDAGAAVSNWGDIDVQADSIDNVLRGERVTFIKMDIEGAEFNALKGAYETIKKYKPKLAISIYHKPEDIVELPNLILSICPDYRFAIRHYTSDIVETVLYAW